MSQSQQPTAAHAVGRALGEQGVEHVFGVTGSGNFVVTSSLIEAGAAFVAARHEAGAVTMADGYARAGGGVGVASVHQGPGFTNTLTGLAEAVKSRSSVLLITGDTSDGQTRSNFYVPQTALADSLGALSERPASAAEAPATALRALARAASAHLPVVLHLPLNVQHHPAPALGSAPSGQVSHSSTVAAGAAVREDRLERLVAAIGSARRPLVLAGRGVWTAGCADGVEKLRERLGALLATSAAAHGLFAGNPWSLGICGGFASGPAAALVREADLVIGLGVSYTKWTTRHGHGFAPDATVVQVDHDPSAFAPDANLTVEGDVAEVVAALLSRIPGGPAERWDTAVGTAAVAATSWHEQPYQDESGGGLIDPRTLSIEVDRLLPAERTVVVDGGHFVGFPSMYWRVPDPAGYLFTGAGFQSIGLGLGTAAGAALARPERVTVLAVGDGGLHMSLSELDTLARLRLPVLVVVYNDAAYGAEVHHYKDTGADLGLVRFPDTDFVRLAAGFGVDAVTVREPGDLAAITRWLSADDRGPLLLDCKVVPTVVADYQAEAFIGH